MVVSQFGSVNAFNPDTDNWVAYVETFFNVNGIKMRKNVPVLVTFLGVKAYELLKTIIALADQNDINLITALHTPKPLIIARELYLSILLSSISYCSIVYLEANSVKL